MPLELAVPVVLALVGVTAVLLLSNRPRMLRQVVAGSILIFLGIVLAGSQISADPLRLAFGAALLTWAAVGIGVIAGRGPARPLGLLLAVVGCLVALWGSSQARPGGNLILVKLFFTVRDPYFAWINVGFAATLFAVLSGIAALLLLRPLVRPSIPP
jgi:hypothetical protein